MNYFEDIFYSTSSCFSFSESGPDVKFNSRLEGLIEKARTISMPKEKIENAIKSGTGVSLNLIVLQEELVLALLLSFIICLYLSFLC